MYFRQTVAMGSNQIKIVEGEKDASSFISTAYFPLKLYQAIQQGGIWWANKRLDCGLWIIVSYRVLWIGANTFPDPDFIVHFLSARKKKHATTEHWKHSSLSHLWLAKSSECKRSQITSRDDIKEVISPGTRDVRCLWIYVCEFVMRVELCFGNSLRKIIPEDYG